MKTSNITNEQLVKVIEEHLRDELSIEILANYFNYSQFYFSRLFKGQMGISIMDYVCKRRLILASEEIIKGMCIIDAAIEFGWQSHNGFAKAFKKEFGFSPSLLRAMIIEISNHGGSIMSHVFLKQTDECATKEQLIELLMEEISQNKIKSDFSLSRIISCAVEAYEGINRYSGDEYITHTLNVAIILAQLEVDINVIEAGLFCDVAKKSSKALSDILSVLPKSVGCIVEKVSNADMSKLGELSEPALLVKIAERLHNMRTIQFMDENKKALKAKETVEVFMPIARRLGNEKIISELNDLSIKYI